MRDCHILVYVCSSTRIKLTLWKQITHAAVFFTVETDNLKSIALGFITAQCDLCSLIYPFQFPPLIILHCTVHSKANTVGQMPVALSVPYSVYFVWILSPLTDFFHLLRCSVKLMSLLHMFFCFQSVISVGSAGQGTLTSCSHPWIFCTGAFIRQHLVVNREVREDCVDC